MRRLDRFCALALLFASATATAEPVVLKDIRLWASPDSTRVVLDLSAPASHAMFALSDPERIVVDLEQTEADLATLKMPEGTGVVSAVRLGAREGGGLRVVLDVGAKVLPKSFLTPPNETYGDRLVIDLGLQQAPRPVKVAKNDGQRDVVVAIKAQSAGMRVQLGTRLANPVERLECITAIPRRRGRWPARSRRASAATSASTRRPRRWR